MRSRGFTMLELLIVIAIIAVLAAVIFPVFALARARARQSTCLSNLQQIAMADKMYASDNNGKWPITGADARCAMNPWWDPRPPSNSYGSLGTDGQWGYLYLPFQVLQHYLKSREIWRCPNDQPAVGTHSDDTFPEPFCCPCRYNEMSSHYEIRMPADGPAAAGAGGHIGSSYTSVMWGDYRNSTECREDGPWANDFFGEWLETRDPGKVLLFWDAGAWHNRGANYAWADGHAEWRLKQPRVIDVEPTIPHP